MHKYLSIDARTCSNCRLCETWCSFTKTGECGPAFARVRIYPIDTDGVSVPIVCSHCEEAFCMAVCPTKALKRDSESGAVLLDDDICIGCRSCTLACPFGAVFQQPDGKIVKCDLCKGLPEPVCAAHCPRAAIIWERPELLTLSKQRRQGRKLSQSLTHGGGEGGESSDGMTIA